MILVKEYKGKHGIGYDISLDGEKIKDVFIQRINREYEGKKYSFLIDSFGNVDNLIFKYLNFNKKLLNENDREQAASALKLLLSYEEIINKKVEEFEKKDVYNFSDFIIGISTQGTYYSQELISTRSNNTHNCYISCIRMYLQDNEIENKYFFEKNIIYSASYILGANNQNDFSKYTINKSSNTINPKYVPKYISNDEYKRIIKFIEDGNTPNRSRDKLIIDLLYTRGLRLGEVLGMTIEDIKINKRSGSSGILYIRNRVSDKKYQHAKTCYKPTSKGDYLTKVYNTKDTGYQSILLPPGLMREINTYLEESRDVFNISEKKWINMNKFARADSIKDINYENYYLFLNKDGRALSSSGWNKVVKKIFMELEIDLDVKVKRDNLNHRFRHGFAMYLLKKEAMEIHDLKIEMRHRSIHSTLVYINPTEDEMIKKHEEIEKNMKGKLYDE